MVPNSSSGARHALFSLSRISHSFATSYFASNSQLIHSAPWSHLSHQSISLTYPTFPPSARLTANLTQTTAFLGGTGLKLSLKPPSSTGDLDSTTPYDLLPL